MNLKRKTWVYYHEDSSLYGTDDSDNHEFISLSVYYTNFMNFSNEILESFLSLYEFVAKKWFCEWN